MAQKKTSANKATKKAAKKKTVATKAPAAKKGGLKKASVARAADAEKSAADKKATPIVFSLDDVEALVASRKDEEEAQPKKTLKKAVKKVAPKTRVIEVEEDKPAEKRVLGAASLADILGFNPAQKKNEASSEADDIPKKWMKYYKLLLELRQHVSDELDLHTADTLKHDDSATDPERIEADGGTDAFDRDFALSLVSNEQEALNEVEEAIMRMKDGSYGVCEVTGEPIDKERLTAVPFARFSLEGQKEYERNNRRRGERTTSGGLFGDATDAPKILTDEDE